MMLLWYASSYVISCHKSNMKTGERKGSNDTNIVVENPYIMSEAHVETAPADTSEEKDDEEIVALLPPPQPPHDRKSERMAGNNLRRTPGPNNMRRPNDDVSVSVVQLCMFLTFLLQTIINKLNIQCLLYESIG